MTIIQAESREPRMQNKGLEAFATMPKTDYLKMLAHDLQRASAL